MFFSLSAAALIASSVLSFAYLVRRSAHICSFYMGLFPYANILTTMTWVFSLHCTQTSSGYGPRHFILVSPSSHILLSFTIWFLACFQKAFLLAWKACYICSCKPALVTISISGITTSVVVCSLILWAHFHMANSFVAATEYVTDSPCKLFFNSLVASRIWYGVKNRAHF